MAPLATPPRRFLLIVLAALSILSFTYLVYRPTQAAGHGTEPIHHVSVSDATLKGDVIMSKLGNETLKAELGRAAWKVLHTTMARFPDKPSLDEQEALSSYLHLFARLYPCGECASHFRLILKKFPPQVRTRSSAAVWACHVHNEVNKSLKKEIFDCANIGDFYDCGCGDEKVEGGKAETKGEGGAKNAPKATTTPFPELKFVREKEMPGG